MYQARKSHGKSKLFSSNFRVLNKLGKPLNSLNGLKESYMSIED